MFSLGKINMLFLLYFFFLRSFASKPHVFVLYTRSTKPNDAMHVWLENVLNSGRFEVCLREFLPLDGKHQDAVVVHRKRICSS